MKATEKYWVIVPAAGFGQRMKGDRPKQYLSILNKTIIEWTLERLLGWQSLSGIVIAIHEQDTHWGRMALSNHSKIITVRGGDTRIESVYRALQHLEGKIAPKQLVLVHDVVRPCVLLSDIDQLIMQVQDRKMIGGLLGFPVSDTLKHVTNENSVKQTVAREGVWHAATPQVFPCDLLLAALDSKKNQSNITDEASAIESLGYTPLMVSGQKTNIKITHRHDLELARCILEVLKNDQ